MQELDDRGAQQVAYAEVCMQKFCIEAESLRTIV